MTVPFLEPGTTNAAVPRMKRRLVTRMVKLGKKPLVTGIAIRTKTYGPEAVHAVEEFQRAKGLHVDGRVGKNTWGALGVHEKVGPPPISVAGAETFHGGTVVIPAGANLPGKPMARMTIDYVARMAEHFGKPIVISTGTNHSTLTSGGNVSDHSTGHAADIGMHSNGGTIDGPVGDKIMEAALLEAGVSKSDAPGQARHGGLLNFRHDGMKIQLIWKVEDHHDHVHVAAKPG
jgi:putative peptidoglycan binding protein